MSHFFPHYNPILCHVSSRLTSSPTHNDPAPILQPQLINRGQADADTVGQIRSLKLSIVLVLLNCGGKIAGGHDLDGDLSNPIASRWSPSRPGHAIRADNVLQ